MAQALLCHWGAATNRSMVLRPTIEAPDAIQMTGWHLRPNRLSDAGSMQTKTEMPFIGVHRAAKARTPTLVAIVQCSRNLVPKRRPGAEVVEIDSESGDPCRGGGMGPLGSPKGL
jgi:hypothetical protein